jgi:hypothetical protein
MTRVEESRSVANSICISEIYNTHKILHFSPFWNSLNKSVLHCRDLPHTFILLHFFARWNMKRAVQIRSAVQRSTTHSPPRRMSIASIFCAWDEVSQPRKISLKTSYITEIYYAHDLSSCARRVGGVPVCIWQVETLTNTPPSPPKNNSKYCAKIYSCSDFLSADLGKFRGRMVNVSSTSTVVFTHIAGFTFTVEQYTHTSLLE